MADARRPKKADYKIQGSGTVSRDPASRMAKKKIEAQVENVRAHQIPVTATIDDLVDALNQRGAAGFIKTTELCSEIVNEFGGLKAFAKEYRSIYLQTDSNHLKAKMAESVVKLITGVNKTNGEEDPVDQMSEEDLAREWMRLHKLYGAGNEPTAANDGLGLAAVPQGDGGVGQAPERGSESVPSPPECGTIPRVQEENPPDRLG